MMSRENMDHTEVSTESLTLPRRIAYFVGLFPNLTETFVIREINALAKRGFDISVFAVKRPLNLEIERSLMHVGTRCCYARPDNLVRHFIVNMRGLFLHPVRYIRTLKVFVGQFATLELSLFGRLLFHFFCGVGFSDQLRREGIEHIHCHFTTGSNIGLAAHLFCGVPFSFTAHASGDIFVKPQLLEEKLEHASFVSPVSNYSKKYLDSITGYKHGRKLHVVYNSLNSEEVEQLLGKEVLMCDRRNTKGNHFRIVSVGSLIGVKGFPTLLEACRILLERKRPIKCSIIGGGPDRPILARLISEWRLEDCVVLSGYLSLRDIYKALIQADTFVLLSEIHANGYRDGFPTVILEAMLMSLPVVSTWISGIPEMVIPGKTGYLVPERDASAAADVIEQLILNSELRFKFGEEGRQRVLDLFSVERNIRILSALLQKSAEA